DAHASAPEPRLLDGFEDASPWRVVASDQGLGQLRTGAGAEGRALCLDYDFNGVAGHVGSQRDLPLALPPDYRCPFQLRGYSPGTGPRLRLGAASGGTGWGGNRPRRAVPRQWTAVQYRRRHVEKAWGPDPDPVLREAARLEFTIASHAGGRGSVCFDQLVL